MRNRKYTLPLVVAATVAGVAAGCGSGGGSTSGRPMLAWALRLLARDRSYIVDAEGRERDVTLGLLLRWSWQLTREAMASTPAPEPVRERPRE